MEPGHCEGFTTGGTEGFPGLEKRRRKDHCCEEFGGEGQGEEVWRFEKLEDDVPYVYGKSGSHLKRKMR